MAQLVEVAFQRESALPLPPVWPVQARAPETKTLIWPAGLENVKLKPGGGEMTLNVLGVKPLMPPVAEKSSYVPLPALGMVKFSPLPGRVRLPLTLIWLPAPVSRKVRFELPARLRLPVVSVPTAVGLPGTMVLPATLVTGPLTTPPPESVCAAASVRPAPPPSPVVSNVAPEATVIVGEKAMLLAAALLNSRKPPLTFVAPL